MTARTPFPADGEWTRDPSWQETEDLRDPCVLSAALQALRDVFPPEWLRDLPQALEHPLAFDCWMRAGRLDLLELGLALGLPSVRRAHVRKRLRVSKEYLTTRAELQAGLLLRATGAAVKHEPCHPKRGPDWEATWPGGRLGVEVKCMATGAHSHARMQAVSAFLTNLMMELQGVVPTEAAWLDFELDPMMKDELVLQTIVRSGRPRALAIDAAEAIRSSLPDPTSAGRYSMGRAGTYEIRLGLGGEPRFQFVGTDLPRDLKTEYHRIRDELLEASSQLRKLEGVPGMIMLDMARDHEMFAHYGTISADVMTEEWGRDVAAVIFVEGQTSGGGAHTLLYFAPGPRAEAVAATQWPGLRVCDRGHFHVDAITKAVLPCDAF